MTAELQLGHVGPWTEADYFALGETPGRIELFDGSLLVSPGPTGMHQHIARRLANALEAPARARDLDVVEAVDVRLHTGRIFIPDVILTAGLDRSVFPAEEVVLACEVVSPGNAGTDRVLKMHVYAEAGIPCYLLVEPGDQGVKARLHRLDGTHYVRHTEAGPGGVLRIAEPVRLDLDLAALLTR